MICMSRDKREGQALHSKRLQFTDAYLAILEDKFLISKAFLSSKRNKE